MSNTQQGQVVMPKTVSVSEAKNRLSAMMKWAVENSDEVIVESRGKPKAVIMPFGEYQQLVTLREKALKEEAINKLETIAKRIQEKNTDLTKKEAEQISDDISQETNKRMESEGKVKFKN